MNAITRLLLPLALLALAACGGGSDAAGTWKLDSDALFTDNQAAMNPTGEELEPDDVEAMKGMMGQMEATLELKSDGTMTGVMKAPSMLGGSEAMEMTGTWTLDGDKLTMNTKDGKSGKEEVMTGTLADGKLTVVNATGGQEIKMTFVRE